MKARIVELGDGRIELHVEGIDKLSDFTICMTEQQAGAIYEALVRRVLDRTQSRIGAIAPAPPPPDWQVLYEREAQRVETLLAMVMFAGREPS